MNATVSAADPRPLYAQIREVLLGRIKSGQWLPGQLIPNEFEIAAEFSVSQGTARKAIDLLAGEGLVIRRQGKGTYVVEHTPADVLFRFFQLYSDDGAQLKPSSPGGRPIVGQASVEEAAALDIEVSAPVIRIVRVRTRDAGKPLVHETIVLPEAPFPGLADLPSVPNTLYDMFQKTYGLMIAHADERITAVHPVAEVAAALSVSRTTPLLRIERVAFGLDGQRLEWRVSLCRLDGAHYLARLR